MLTEHLLLMILGHTPRSKIRAPHTRTPHHATLGHYFQIHTRILAAFNRSSAHTSHSDTHCPTLGQYSRIHPSSGSVCLSRVPTLHYFTVRAPDSFSLKDEHATNLWSVLRIHAVFLLLLQLIFFFLTNYYSHPEV